MRSIVKRGVVYAVCVGIGCVIIGVMAYMVALFYPNTSLEKIGGGFLLVPAASYISALTLIALDNRVYPNITRQPANEQDERLREEEKWT